MQKVEGSSPFSRSREASTVVITVRRYVPIPLLARALADGSDPTTRDRWSMLDATAVEVCAHGVAGAAAYGGDQDDLMLTTVALARDLIDTQGDQAANMLDRASREATALLDGSDLGADAFAKALHRLAAIRAGVQTRLAGCAESEIGI